jgi:type IV pilus assembly protein PilX
MMQRKKIPQHHTPQRGVALVISLILLVIMTLLGLGVMRGVTMEERMAGQTYDRSVAFQATEAALRQIETTLEANKPVAVTGSGCAMNGGLMVCEPPPACPQSPTVCPAATQTAMASYVPRWEDSAFGSWTDLTALAYGTSSIDVTPKYFVEYLGNTFACRPGDSLDSNSCKRYRITARVIPSDVTTNTKSRATVMLQSIYATD